MVLITETTLDLVKPRVYNSNDLYSFRAPSFKLQTLSQACKLISIQLLNHNLKSGVFNEENIN